MQYDEITQKGLYTLCPVVSVKTGLDRGQHWLEWYFVDYWHQAITWPNVVLSSKGFCEKFDKKYSRT